jgi:hypothetical protein
LPMGVEPAFEGVRSPRRPSVRLSNGGRHIVPRPRAGPVTEREM